MMMMMNKTIDCTQALVKMMMMMKYVEMDLEGLSINFKIGDRGERGGPSDD